MIQGGNTGTGRTRQRTSSARGSSKLTEGGVAEVRDTKYMPTGGGRSHEILVSAGRVRVCPFVVQVPETHQNNTKRYSARGIARKGMARRGTLWLEGSSTDDTEIG